MDGLPSIPVFHETLPYGRGPEDFTVLVKSSGARRGRQASEVAIVSTVIKAGQSGPVLLQLAAVDLADHLREAHAIVEDAKRQALLIVRRAEDEAKRLRGEAGGQGYESGYQEGLLEGEETGRRLAHAEAVERFDRSHRQLVGVLEQAIQQFESLKSDIEIEARRDMVDAAVRLAGRLTFAIGKLDRQAAMENVRRVIEAVGCKTHATIHVHPDDWDAVQLFAKSLSQRVEAGQTVSVQKDDSMAPGGCLVRTGSCEVDATLESQVDELIETLLGGAGHGE